MIRKTYYEDGCCFLDTNNKKMSKKGLSIKIKDNDFKNNIHYKIAYKTINRFNKKDDGSIVIDNVSKHRIIVLHSYITGLKISENDNKKIIKQYSLSALRIAREYAKDNLLNLEILELYGFERNVNEIVYNKEKKLTYPLTGEELKKLANLNLKINILVKGIIQTDIKLPNNISAEIDISNMVSLFYLELYDDNNQISNNYKNIKFVGKNIVKINFMCNKYANKKYSIRVVELPKDNKTYNIHYPKGWHFDFNLYKNKSPLDIIFGKLEIDIYNKSIILVDKFLHSYDLLDKKDKDYLKELFIIMRENNIDILHYLEDLKTMSKNNKILICDIKDAVKNSSKAIKTRKFIKKIKERNQIIDNFINDKK